ncbi:ParB/RepB/Spo0J family partition protein [Pseudobdellovibrio sp. HCB154]|uniref:ParB/RepB/Spo0J family partition protein n=1 Tax=Pseudobdellovibrio sp. HCB154 TaxID=3386277 RepID=UPI0039175DE4
MENSTENSNKKRLGRGLGSLLGGATQDLSAPPQAVKSQAPAGATTQPKSVITQETKPVVVEKVVEKIVEKIVEQKIDEDKRVWQIAVDKLVPGQFQPRKKFEKEALNELAQSIKENGILQPIVVRKRQAGGFEIVAGERRWRASQLAGLHEIPALIKTFSDQDALQLALIENIQREDLDPIEEAESYQRLMEEFNLSQQQVAEKVGKERSSVANAVRLLVLPFEIKNMIADKQLSVGHAKVILSVEGKPEQMRLAKAVQAKNLSVRALEQMVKSGGHKDESSESQIKEMDMPEKLAQQLASQVQKALGTKTTISYKKGKGELTIHFYSDEQLNSIYERLTE